MPRLPLGNSYQSTSLIAGAQRSVNLYSERNASSAPTQITKYPRPGLTALPTPVQGLGRGLYTATNGDVFAVVGQTLYFISPNFVWTPIISLTVQASTPVLMADNGQTLVAVDGSTTGYFVGLTPQHIGGQIADPNFLGADRVTFLNFFLLFNQPSSPNFYSTNVTSTVFNALSFGSLTQYPGNVIGLIASEAALWVFGPYKGEVWADAGTSPFAFQLLSGIIIEHGLIGKYALARQDVNVYWLSQSPEGARLAMRGVSNSAQRISTHAIEEEWLSYPTVTDCVVTTYQIRGHSFVCFDFPTADRTWVFDEANQEDPWHEEAFFDTNGVQHRTKDLFKTYGYGRNLSLDWNTGQLYQRDGTNFTDNGTPCVYIQDLPHLVDADDSRMTLWRAIADMETASGFVPSVPIGSTQPPYMTLLISHDRGKSFFPHSDQQLSGPFGFNTRPTFNRCGVAFDLVLRLQWSPGFKTSLNGAFAVVELHEADI